MFDPDFNFSLMNQPANTIGGNDTMPIEAARDWHAADEVLLPVIAEVAEVKTVEEHIGTLRVTKATQMDDVQVQLPLNRDFVQTKRVPVNLPVDKVQAAHYRGDVWVVPVYEERLVKTLFLVEELHLVKRVEQTRHEETVTLRREVLTTERFDVASNTWVTDPS